MKNKLVGRVWLIYIANMVLALMFLISMTDIVWLSCILGGGLIIASCLLAYNEGGNFGERACTVERLAQKRIEEGKRVDDSMKKEFFNKKHALALFLCISLPLFVLAVANLAASPNYPVIVSEQQEEEADPFAYSEENAAEPEMTEPGWCGALRVTTRILFAPLLPVYMLVNAKTLYILFLFWPFVIPAAGAVGYLRGPKIREAKLEEIAKGKVRKKRNLLVNRQPRQPKQPKPLV